jgi:fimbrial isopeptide formation D2 family protein
MFKKIVSQLSFSPALVGQLSFYAKRLRKEQVTRRLGLVFVALALVVQGLTVFQAPEPANASNNNDFVIGGLGTGSSRDFNRFLAPYDRNDRNLRDVFDYFGITRGELTSMRFEQFTIGDRKSYGFENRAGSVTIPITNSSWQQVTTIYGRPLTSFGNSPQGQTWAYVGHSSKIGWFAILTSCGNLVTDVYPEAPTPPPAPANIVASKTAVNNGQGGIDASKTSAKANERITYTITARNTGGTAKTVDMSDNLSEVLKYASLVSTGGGTYNSTSKVLSWPAANLGPGASVSHSYTVLTNRSLISTDENCRMRNNFLDQVVTVPVACSTPPAKISFSKTALNTTQGNVDATKTTARENDRITFTLTAKNSGGTAKEITFEDTIGDALEYAKLIENGGGTYNENTRKLSWPKVNLQPGETQVRTFTMQILDAIPATPKGVSDPSSYDCRIENTFYTASVIIPVNCTTPPKVIENIVTELPQTGPGENMLFAGILLAVVVFFYYRSKQLNTEVRLIRRDINGGTF